MAGFLQKSKDICTSGTWVCSTNAHSSLNDSLCWYRRSLRGYEQELLVTLTGTKSDLLFFKSKQKCCWSILKKKTGWEILWFLSKGPACCLHCFCAQGNCTSARQTLSSSSRLGSKPDCSLDKHRHTATQSHLVQDS